MLIIQTIGHNPVIFQGSSAKSVVLKMMRQDFLTVTKTDYMQEVKDRLQIVYDVYIKFSNHLEFLKELEREGFITIIKEELH
jgi:cytochrome c biogenesis factor